MTSPTAIRTTNGRGRLFNRVIDTAGDTPAIRINNLGVAGRTLYVKAGFFNPASSVKDRMAESFSVERRKLMRCWAPPRQAAGCPTCLKRRGGHGEFGQGRVGNAMAATTAWFGLGLWRTRKDSNL